MQFIAYLNFNGTCKEAFAFYAKTFGGRIAAMTTHGESPMGAQVPAELKDKIMHASLEVPDGGVLMGGDHPQGRTVQPTGFCVSVQVKDASQAQQIFKDLSEGGKVQMPFEKTPWSQGFGMCIDRFDIPWMVNCLPAA